MDSRTTKTIDRLHALINHPRTSDDERDAARRALKRIRDRQANSPSTPTTTQAYVVDGWRGSKYEQARYLTLAQIAKLMREDIKMARKAGKVPAGSADLAIPDPIADAPDQIKYSIRSEYYSGGGGINITIKNIPAEWGWTDETDQFGYPRKVATRALSALFAEIKRIHNAYNRDNSDAQADYFDSHYGGSVQTDERIHMPRTWEFAR